MTKHKIYHISIDNKLDLDAKILEVIDNFLKDSNIVYVNHAIAVFNEAVDEFGRTKPRNKYLIVSFVYKDLTETEMDLTKTSSKTKAIVKKSIEKGDTIKAPAIDTKFEETLKTIKS